MYGELLPDPGASQAGVQHVPQPVAQQVPGEHDYDNCYSGKQGQPGIHGHILGSRAIKHASPGGLIGRSPNAQKAESGLGYDCSTRMESRDNYLNGKDIREDIFGHGTQVTGPYRAEHFWQCSWLL